MNASITVNAHVSNTTRIDHVEFPALPGGRPQFVSIDIGAATSQVILMALDPADLDRLIEVCRKARRFLAAEATRRAGDNVQPCLVEETDARAS